MDYQIMDYQIMDYQIMDYQIIATLGPASCEPAVWEALLAAGATAFRLNTSHLDLAALEGWLTRLDDLRRGGTGLILDLQGSKWRLGDLPSREVPRGAAIEFCLAPTGDGLAVPVPHADFFLAAQALGAGAEVVMNDARVRAQLERVAPERALGRVTQGGRLAAHKSITLPDSPLRLQELSPKDRAIAAQAAGLTGVGCAVSYVKDAEEAAVYRRLLGPQLALSIKLERGSAIAAAADFDQAQALWVCRGDLGAELGLAGMAAAVARITAQLASLPCPVLLAGQVLEHLTTQPDPTRAEVCGLYDALHAGYAGVVLSDETAIGRDPAAAVRAAALLRS